MVMAFVTGLGQVAATLATMSIGALGWFDNAHYVLAPLAILAAVLTAIFVTDDRKVAKIRAEEEREQLEAATAGAATASAE